MRQRHGFTALLPSIVLCLVSVNGPAMFLWKQWSLSTLPSKVHLTVWIRRSLQKLPILFQRIHADGLLKDEEIYNIFDTGKLLNRPPLVAINNISGVAGIAYWLNQYYNNTGESAISKKDPLVLYIKKWVDEQYADGRITYITTSELVSLVEQYQAQNNIS